MGTLREKVEKRIEQLNDVRKVRQLPGTSKYQLARELGVSSQRFYQLLNNQNVDDISLGTLKSLAEVLKVDLNWFAD
jgi:transcriptional regulator with XRE-family HTH domain